MELFINEHSEKDLCNQSNIYIFVSFHATGPRGERLIWGPMDDNALQNHAGPDKANTGCPPHVYCGNFDEYALRDIKKGEELLCDYGKFFSLNFLEYKKWKWFGL